MKIVRFLIVNANGDTRVLTKKPKLAWNEVAFTINVTIPDTWATVRGSIDIEMPAPPDALIDAELVPAESAGD